MIVVLTFLTVIPGEILAVTIHVPADSPTIQAGIAAAESGDTVLVADGTYSGPGNRDIDLGGRIVVVMSENGPIVTIIECQGDSLEPHRGFVFQNGEDSTSVVQGFTIRGGWAYDGGGIYCDWQSSPCIRWNIITGNHAYWSGGGIACYASAPAIVGNLIRGNSSTWSGGGVFCNWYASPVIRGNVISENTTFGGGGVLCWYHSEPIIVENSVTGNEAVYGCGIACYQSSPLIERNSISGNAAAMEGGGIMCDGSSPEIVRNTIFGNSALWDGGGISCRNSSAPLVTNCIVWGDTAFFTDEIYMDGSGSLTVTYSDVAGGWPGEGNIDTPPLYADPLEGDFALLSDSPCIDSGDPEAEVPQDGGDRVDMGAIEYPYPESPPLRLTFFEPPEVGRPGETVMWGFTVENTTGASVEFDGWVAVSGPANATRDSLTQVRIPPRVTASGMISLYIPRQAPPGSYTVKGRVGILHEDIWDGEVFDGEVSAVPGRSVPPSSPDDWKIRIWLSSRLH